MRTLAELGRALDEARRRKGLSNKDLAERVGLTPLTVGHVLSGKSAVRATNLMALADELDLALVLLPKAVAETVEPNPPPAVPGYLSPLERVLQQLNDGGAARTARSDKPEGQGR